MQGKRLALMALGLSLGLLLAACGGQTSGSGGGGGGSGGGGGGGGGSGGSSPSFALALNPTSLSVQQGGSSTTTLTITPQNGFTGTVNLSLVNGQEQVPQGLDLSPQSVQVTGSSSVDQPLTISASSSTPTGTYRIKVRGTSGSLTQEADLTVTVQAPSGSGGGGGGSGGGGGGGGGGGNGATVTVRQLDSTPLVGAYYRVGSGSWQTLTFSNGQAAFTATGDYEVAVRCQSGTDVYTDVYLFKATVSQANTLTFACQAASTGGGSQTFQVSLPASIGSYTIQPGDAVLVGTYDGAYTGSNPVSVTTYLPDGTQDVLLAVLRATGGPPPTSVTPIGYKLVTGLNVASGGTYTVDQSGWQPFAATRTIDALSLPSGYQGHAAVLFFRDGMKSATTVGGVDRYGTLGLPGKYLGMAQAFDRSGNSLLALKDTGGSDWTPSLMSPWGTGQFSVSGNALTFAHPDAQAYILSATGLLKDSTSNSGLRVGIAVYSSGSATTYQVPVVPGLNYALEDPNTRTVNFALGAFRGDLAKAAAFFGSRTPTESDLTGLDVALAERYGSFSGSSYTLP